ncbi:MAG: DUF1207 domain-containing protein [Candidatus Marinimicrobia bacterium]|nr:DUF1207 domain-containing protein [Candidatus Neomarinimicrobiota bacterium]MCF7921888.1 DUF1207 domain-containing protein [Candidatus Neomarinimicrobiota bacterium]
MQAVTRLIFQLTFVFTFALNPLFANEVSWLPQGSFFPTRYLDPAACQQGISLFSYEVAGESQQLMYVPISLSLRQQFIRSELAGTRRWELGMEFSIFSQFSIVDAGEAYMGGLQNADYRISSIFHYQHNPHTLYRVSLFHQSSHLGDDYIIRNFIVSPTLRTQNYEQLDFTLLKRISGWNLYGTAGYNVSPNTVRKRLMLQCGGMWSHQLANHPGLAFLAGLDMKIYEHNVFIPNTRIAAGIEFARTTSTPVKLLLSYYQGHLPYSTLEYQKVRLMGLSLLFDIPAYIN